ncbi:MAG: adenylate/guanylate cyclase domain-containing protein [Bacteroidales bacterium]|nr:adenylate/guanylate cyclase domain-containing protein [Bacteroidales bacterium]MCF8455990.1 adenylate/guanylate cyclase domain-containing protein [Bacteroidales bacterium]
MLKKYLLSGIIILLTNIPISLHAQSIQSLEQKLLSASDQEKTGILIQLGYKHVNDNPQNSLQFGLDALKNAEKQSDKHGQAMAYGLVGQSYYLLKDYKQATRNFERESKLIDPSGKPWMVNQFNLGQSSRYEGRKRRTINYFEESLKEARKLANEDYILKNYEALFDVNLENKNHKEALEYFKLYIAEKDERFLEQNKREINQMHNAYQEEINEIEEEKEAITDTLLMTKEELQLVQLQQQVKDLELKEVKLKQTRLLWIILLLAIIGGIILVFYLQKRKSNKIIIGEKAKSDKLLHNILPAKVVKELKENGSSIPENFLDVSVFFSDFVGFTELSSKVKPEVLISELNEIFTSFDEIMEKYHCERIKTIGDAYLAVCGLPEKDPENVSNILSASLDIVDWLKERNQKTALNWQIRIGVHTGNLIGGIVGTKKYIYDVFGDTINTASRMESNSVGGKINVSEQTYGYARSQFIFSERPTIEVKGKGKMKMFFLEGKKRK